MPALGADMEAGTVLQWLVKPGDTVKRGDIVAVVDTEKATIEVEVFEAGVVQNILVQEGEKVPVGAVLAMIGAAGEAAAPAAEIKPVPVAAKVAVEEKPKPVVVPPPAPAAPVAPAAPARMEKRAAVRAEKPLTPKPSPAPPHHLRVSPLAMRVAAELGVDVSKVKGTGPEGAVTKADVERAAKAAAAPPARPAEPEAAAAITPTPAAAPPGAAAAPRPAMSGEDRKAAMRKAIAAAMARSKREIPHYYLGAQIDMSRAIAWLQAENLKRPVNRRLLYSVLLLKAVALAAREFPEMNGYWIDGACKPSDAVHVGVAISLRQGGLIAPAIHDVERKNLDEIMVNLYDLVKRVRAGVLRSSEIADATITVTSLGDQGVESVYGIIYPPQVALVGARPVVMGTLAADHRASDGHRGGLFLAAIERLLQEPEKLD
jgi:pyruvate dehydrogenase E2 component (dihydrolipoamide acetyltransferase)